MADTTTLRIRTHTRDTLGRLAREDGLSATEFLDRLIAREEQSRLLAGMNDDFSNLRRDPVAWEEFKAETAACDATSAPA